MMRRFGMFSSSQKGNSGPLSRSNSAPLSRNNNSSSSSALSRSNSTALATATTSASSPMTTTNTPTPAATAAQYLFAVLILTTLPIFMTALFPTTAAVPPVDSWLPALSSSQETTLSSSTSNNNGGIEYTTGINSLDITDEDRAEAAAAIAAASARNVAKARARLQKEQQKQKQSPASSNNDNLTPKKTIPLPTTTTTTTTTTEKTKAETATDTLTTTTTTDRNIKRKLFLFWIKENPEMGGSGIFRYYYDIGHAINQQGPDVVQVCPSTFQDKRRELQAQGQPQAAKAIRSLTQEEEYDYLVQCYQRTVAYEQQQPPSNDEQIKYKAIMVMLYPTKYAREIHNDRGLYMRPFVANLRTLMTDIGAMGPSALLNDTAGAVADNGAYILEEDRNVTPITDPARTTMVAAATQERLGQLGKHKRPCLTVLFMANMVFNFLTPKMKQLKQPFQDFGLLSRKNLKPKKKRFQVISSTWSPRAPNFARFHKIPFFFCPFGTDIQIFNLTSHEAAAKPWKDRPYDVFIRWDTHVRKYRFRRETQYLLAKFKATTRETEQILEAGNVSDIVTLAPDGFMGESRYLSSIANSKMAVSTIGIPDKADLLGTRHYEIQASGTTLLLSERPTTGPQIMGHEQYGFVENETYAAFSSVTELVEKIRYYKNHPEEAERMIRNAQQQAVLHGSWFSRGTLYVDKIWEMSRC